MKLISILTISVLLFSSCANSSQNEQPKPVDENWEMSSHTVTSNTYNKSGLLDTSYKTMYVYQLGLLTITIKSVIVRTYENNKLTNEKEFTFWEDGTQTLSNELIQQFDKNGNLKITINKMGGHVLSKTMNEYDEMGKVVKGINLFQTMEAKPNDYNLDSAVAHRNDEKQFHYDTTVIFYEYDANGNQIQTTISDTKGIVLNISFNRYLGNEKIFSFDRTSQGDTTTKFVYKQEGDYIKEVAYIKEMGAVDTTWSDKGKIIRVIGHNDKMKMKYKSFTTYNNKGDVIENFSYK